MQQILESGKILRGRYKIQELVGQGGMGAVSCRLIGDLMFDGEGIDTQYISACTSVVGD